MLQLHHADGRDAGHMRVGMDVDAGRVGVEDGQGRHLLARSTGRLGRNGGGTLALASVLVQHLQQTVAT